MAQTCDICGKAPRTGNKVSHANNKRRRRWLPNLKSFRAQIGGVVKTLRLCTRCIRSERLVKAAPSARGVNKTSGWSQPTAQPAQN